MKTIEEQLKLLEETVNHFNQNNRASKNGKCCYYNTEDGRGCAIGRLIKDKELCKELDSQPVTSVKYVFDKLPADLKEYGKSFLKELQAFHDTYDIWDDNGLSSDGEEKYDAFVNLIKEGYYQS